MRKNYVLNPNEVHDLLRNDLILASQFDRWNFWDFSFKGWILNNKLKYDWIIIKTHIKYVKISCWYYCDKKIWKWKLIDLIRKTGRVRYGFPNLLSNLRRSRTREKQYESYVVISLEKLSLELHCKRIHTF